MKSDSSNIVYDSHSKIEWHYVSVLYPKQRCFSIVSSQLWLLFRLLKLASRNGFLNSFKKYQHQLLLSASSSEWEKRKKKNLRLSFPILRNYSSFFVLSFRDF